MKGQYIRILVCGTIKRQGSTGSDALVAPPADPSAILVIGNNRLNVLPAIEYAYDLRAIILQSIEYDVRRCRSERNPARISSRARPAKGKSSTTATVFAVSRRILSAARVPRRLGIMIPKAVNIIESFRRPNDRRFMLRHVVNSSREENLQPFDVREQFPADLLLICGRQRGNLRNGLVKRSDHQLIPPRLKKAGAGEGNRTLVCSLGSCRSTIELRPRMHKPAPVLISRDGAARQALWRRQPHAS